MKQLSLWQTTNPSCFDIKSKKNDELIHLINNTLGGSNEEEINYNYNKIIKKVAKEMIIQK